MYIIVIYVTYLTRSIQSEMKYDMDGWDMWDNLSFDYLDAVRDAREIS